MSPIHSIKPGPLLCLSNSNSSKDNSTPSNLGLVTAWEQHHPPQNQSDQHHLRQVQTTLSGVSMVPPSDLNLTEFEAFAYTSNPLELTSVTQSDPAWAHEWSRQQGAEPESDEDDDKDEFREEWNNDHFTQAYINSHRSQFKEIEEQDRLKEARREEEQERQRQVSGGPPRSAWMIAGASTAPHFAAASTTVVETMNISHGSKRLRVPGLDDAFDQQQQQQERHRLERDRTMFSVDEFMGFDQLQENNLFTFHGLNASPPLLLQQHVQPKAIHAQDRFLSLVSDLHLAEQIYYPGASSATLPELSDPHRGHSSGVVAAENGWADQWVSEDRQQKEQTVVVQRYVGAEWNWEKLFGKDPRRQLQLATEANSHSNNNKESNSMDEGDRLRAVALTRLRAVFGHLSLTSSPIHGAPSSTPDVPGP
ncbi:hypothetical protein EDD11_008534 [Mortierella claussenii]|nr:hypothetical protein EDD11_008534 [Mortierella claussenii]